MVVLGEKVMFSLECLQRTIDSLQARLKTVSKPSWLTWLLANAMWLRQYSQAATPTMMSLPCKHRYQSSCTGAIDKD
jgi:hypothetical protein